MLDLVDETCAAGLVVLGSRGLTVIGAADPMVRATLGPLRRAELYRRAADLVDDPVRAHRLVVHASPVPDPGVADRLDALATKRASEGPWAIAASLLNDASQVTEDRLREGGRRGVTTLCVGVG